MRMPTVVLPVLKVNQFSSAETNQSNAVVSENDGKKDNTPKRTKENTKSRRERSISSERHTSGERNKSGDRIKNRNQQNGKGQRNRSISSERSRSGDRTKSRRSKQINTKAKPIVVTSGDDTLSDNQISVGGCYGDGTKMPKDITLDDIMDINDRSDDDDLEEQWREVKVMTDDRKVTVTPDTNDMTPDSKVTTPDTKVMTPNSKFNTSDIKVMTPDMKVKTTPSRSSRKRGSGRKQKSMTSRTNMAAPPLFDDVAMSPMSLASERMDIPSPFNMSVSFNLYFG